MKGDWRSSSSSRWHCPFDGSMRGEECPNMYSTGGGGQGRTGTKTCVGIVCQAEYFALSVIEFCAAFLTFLSLRPWTAD